MDEFTVESVVRGHHIYKTIWTPYIGEKLPLDAEDNNLHDRHAVAVIRNGTVVGYMPRNLLPLSWFFFKNGGSIDCEITGHRKCGNGLEVPCKYTYKSTRRTILKLKKLLNKL